MYVANHVSRNACGGAMDVDEGDKDAEGPKPPANTPANAEEAGEAKANVRRRRLDASADAPSRGRVPAQRGDARMNFGTRLVLVRYSRLSSARPPLLVGENRRAMGSWSVWHRTIRSSTSSLNQSVNAIFK